MNTSPRTRNERETVGSVPWLALTPPAQFAQFFGLLALLACMRRTFLLKCSLLICFPMKIRRSRVVQSREHVPFASRVALLGSLALALLAPRTQAAVLCVP